MIADRPQAPREGLAPSGGPHPQREFPIDRRARHELGHKQRRRREATRRGTGSSSDGTTMRGSASFLTGEDYDETERLLDRAIGEALPLGSNVRGQERGMISQPATRSGCRSSRRHERGSAVLLREGRCRSRAASPCATQRSCCRARHAGGSAQAQPWSRTRGNRLACKTAHGDTITARARGSDDAARALRRAARVRLVRRRRQQRRASLMLPGPGGMEVVVPRPPSAAGPRTRRTA